MSSNKISKLSRIAILYQLVEKFHGKQNIVETVRLAKDLAKIIDEINGLEVSLSTLSEEFINFFPEHWKKRTQFLLIVTQHWPKILDEMNLEDVETPEKRNSIVTQYTQDIRVSSISEKATICETDSIYDEVDAVMEIIAQHHKERVSIISPNADFTRYLTLRLTTENIKFTSTVEDYLPSEELLEGVRENFPRLKETEVRLVSKELTGIVDRPDIPDCSISIHDINDITKIVSNSVVIYTEINETYWKGQEAGGFWLHRILRQKIGLNQSKQNVENLFYYGISKSSKTYLLRSTKSAGQNNQESSILKKLEAITKKSGISINIKDCTKFISQPINILPKTDLNHLNLPSEINVWSIEMLMKDPLSFYAKTILNLQPYDTDDDKRKDVVVAFKNIVRSYFQNQSVSPWVEILKDIDFFAYHKAVDLVSFLTHLNCPPVGFSNLLGSINIPQLRISIYSHADRVIEEGESASLISYQTSTSHSTKEVVYGIGSAILATCFIAERHGFSAVRKPIRKIQIWNLLAPDKNQIITKEIEISKDIVETFGENLVSNLKLYLGHNISEINCKPHKKTLYNKYRHFKRSQA